MIYAIFKILIRKFLSSTYELGRKLLILKWFSIWFQHGPPHLTNLVVQGPPPAQSQSPSQGQLIQGPVTHVIQALPPTQIIHGPPPTQIVQGPPPGYQAPPPHLIHGPPPHGQIPAPYHLGPPPVVSDGVPVMSHSTQPLQGAPVYSVHTSISEEGRLVMRLTHILCRNILVEHVPKIIRSLASVLIWELNVIITRFCNWM